jgi:hypothetical protein
MLLEILTKKHNEILKDVLDNYTSDIESEEYNKIFNACFELADFIVVAEKGTYIDFYETKNLSAVFVLRAISELIDTGNYEYEIDCVRHASSLGGRLRESLMLIDDFFKGKEGMFEILKSTSFFDNVVLIKN